MAFFSMLKKNFKLLIRSRSSAFMVFLGPLLIIALVGLVFSGSGSSDLSVGYFAEEKTDLTTQFIERLGEEKFIVREFFTEEDCRGAIEQGLLHTCIIFPIGFEAGSESGEDLVFVVDNSRINLVYKIIDAVSSILESETKELSYSLTNILLDGINRTVVGLGRVEELSDEVSSAHSEADEAILQSMESSAAMNLGMEPIDLGSMYTSSDNINLTIALLKESINESVKEGLMMVEELSRHLNSNETEEIRQNYNRINEGLISLSNTSTKQVEQLIFDIENLEERLARLDQQLVADRERKQEIESGIMQASSSIATAKESVSSLKQLSLNLKGDLEGITIRRAESIVSPVNTKIELISPKASNILFTFPFLLMLVVMFVSLMLSSTMMIYEKTSKANFRNFMMPLGNSWMIASYVVTILLVVVFQSLIILNLSQWALGIDLLSNPLSTLIVVIVSGLFFTVLGLTIGYLVSTQEAGVMASLVFGSVFLFVSNLVIPLENLAPAFAKAISWNPYIIFSEMLRRSLLFSANIQELMPVLGIMLLVSLVGMAFIVMFSRRN